MDLTTVRRSVAKGGCLTAQTWKIMRLIAVFLFVAGLTAGANGYSQKVTLSLKDASLEKAFREIQKQTGYDFLFTKQMLKDSRPVTIQVKDATVQEALNLCLQHQPLSFTIENNAIVIRAASSQPPPKEGASEPTPLPPPIDVKGQVVNEKGEGVISTVTVKGTKKAVTTDDNGFFVIRGVDENAVLVITATNIEGREIPVNGKSDLATVGVKMKETTMGEVIIKKGYYDERQRFTLGNSVHIDAKTIEQQPVTNPLLALAGRVPGLEITQLTGLPGGGVKVQIQGNNSIGSLSGLTRTDPLIVVDGVPFPVQLAYGNYQETIVKNGSPLNYINPADIESIDILKDADATAIYGSQAGNGAIIITTKKGKAGKTKLTLNMQQGWGKVSRHVDMMNTQQYLEMRREAFRYSNKIPTSNPAPPSGTPFVYAPDLMFWDTTRYTDWQKTLIGGTAKYTNINASISGGTNVVQYLVGGTYNRHTTVFPGDYDDKAGSMHFNINGTSPNQRLRLQLSGSYSYDRNHLPGIDFTNRAVLMEPNAPSLYNANGTLNWAQNAVGTSTFINPLANLSNEFNNTTKNLVSNAILSYRILPGLNVLSSFGYANTQTNVFAAYRLEGVRPEYRPTTQRSATFMNRNMSSWIVEPQLQYTRQLGKGKIDGLIGTTIRKSSYEYLSIYGFGFSTDLLMKTLNAATSVSIDLSNSAITRFNALFGKIGYNWDDKYLINLTARRDGSNKFGDNSKFHNFWSIAGGWIFSEEKWLKDLSFLSFGKLRMSYGTTGSDQIPDFAYLSLYYINNPSIFYQNNISLSVSNISNPNLEWEETNKWQNGIDLSFLKDRLGLSVTYTRNRSSNQLIGSLLPAQTGFSGIIMNRNALVQNTSWEFILNTSNIKAKNLNWSSSFNITIPRNKLIKFPGIENTAYASGTSGVIVGHPLGVFKVVPFAGVNPANGKYLYVTQNGTISTSPTPDDNTKLISPRTYYGGLINRISYGPFQLEFLLQFVRQLGRRDMYFSGSQQPGQYSEGQSNQPVTVIHHWQKPGDNAPFSFYAINGSNAISSMTDALYSYDASYVRLKNLSLSCEFPTKWVKKAHLQSARVYLHGQNLATITRYTGLDPESGGLGMPPLRMITVGGQIDF